MTGLKKTTAVIISFILAASLMAGCTGGGSSGGSSAAAQASSSQAPKEIKATDYVLAFHKYLCTGDRKAAEDVKLESDVLKKLDEVRGQFDDMGSTIAESFDSDYTRMVDKKSVEDFSDALVSVISRVSATATEESSSGDTVTVKISSDYIDVSGLAQSVVMNIISGLSSDSSEEAVKEAIVKVVKGLTDGLYKYEFPKEKKSALIEVKKSGDSWVFKDAEEASKSITELIINTEGFV